MIQRQDHLKKMELKKQKRIEAGLVSERFPTVDGMTIKMTYYHKAENPLLMQRTVNVFPSSYAYFNMECMIKGCEEGGFDLTSAIKKHVKQKKKSFKGKMVCKGTNGDKPPNHASIEYAISIKYSRKKRSK
jgi:hypothetical protein